MSFDLSSLTSLIDELKIKEKQLDIGFEYQFVDDEILKYLPAGGIELDIGALSSNGRIEFGNQDCIAYIKDVISISNNIQIRPKYHFWHCSAIKTHKSAGRRYVVTTNPSNHFMLENESGFRKKVQLSPCKMCIKQCDFDFPWKYSYQNNLDKIEIKHVIGGINEFREFRSEFLNIKTDWMKSGYLFEWPQISRKYRESTGYTCEQCKLLLRKRRYLLHTHHKDMNKKNNKRSNLMALCVECHSKQHHHAHMLKYDTFVEQISLIKVLRGS